MSLERVSRIIPLALFLFASSGAFAQDETGPLIDPSVQVKTMHNSKIIGALRESVNTPDESPAPLDPRPEAAMNLYFARDEGVSARVRKQLAKGIEGDHTGARSLIATDGWLDEFDRVLSQFGYSGTDLADVMTGYLVMTWELINGKSAAANKAGIAAVRGRIANGLLNTPAVFAASDAEKQGVAETLAGVVMLAKAAQREVARSGDRKAQSQLRTSVRRNVRETLGVDLDEVRLTKKGFAPD